MSSQQLRTIEHNPLATQIGSASSRALAYLEKRRQQGVKDELSDGIQASFAILGYRGKVWRMKYQGAEQDLMRTVDGIQEPVPSVGVILVRAASGLSKNWYEKGYTEGSNEAPDCFSTNGINPEPTSPKKQCNVCAICPHNQFGSRVSADGNGRGKACGDSKRIVIVPEADIENEANGGPMLLRIPAASLGDLAKYAGELERSGYPYMGVATRLYFDSKEAYPKILMKAIRPLTDDEFAIVERLYEDPRTVRIIDGTAAPVAEGAAQPPAPSQPLFEVDAAPAPSPAPASTPTPTPAPASIQTETDEEREFREFQAAKKARAEAEARAAAEAAEREAQARAEAEARRQAEEAAANAAAAAQPKEETEEERELREFREHRARQKAAQDAQAAAQTANVTPDATQAPPAQTATPAPAAATQTASADDAAANAGNLPQGFDQLLNGLMG